MDMLNCEREFSIKQIKIINARVIMPDEIMENGCIVVKAGIIDKIGTGHIECGECRTIDAKGHYVSPGFVDIHVHGGGGHDFMDGTREAFLGIAALHSQYGTTSMVPTTLASSNEELHDLFEVYNETKNVKNNGAEFLGFHLEGPYFSPEFNGAQDIRYIRNPKKEEYNQILGLSEDIIRWSIAPELEGASALGAHLKTQGILPSIAHTSANYEEVMGAFENGFTHVTHFYSCMSGVHRKNGYRFAGVIESAYLIDDMTVEIIADGVHLPESLLKLVYKIKGPNHIALVTDAMRAAGEKDGESILGSLKNGQRVIVEDGVAKLTDRTAFAGSVATADRLVRNMIQLAGVSLVDSVKMMTSTPAEIIGVNHKKGSLQTGKDADIIIFDEDIQIKMTMVNGEVVFLNI